MKGQIFSMDFLSAVFIFLAVFGILLISWGSLLGNIEKYNERKDMEIQANMIADFFVSTTGKPQNWQDSPAYAKTIGLAKTDRVIDNDKLGAFIAMDYDEAREKMLIKGYNFCFRLAKSGMEKCDYGEGDGLSVFTSRAVLYNGKADLLQLYIWRYT